MKRITLGLSFLLAASAFLPAGAQEAGQEVRWRPTQRAATLEAGKQYMIFNTAFNGAQDRTGFIYDNGSSVALDGPIGNKLRPSTFSTDNTAYLWTVEIPDGGTTDVYYLKANSGKYTGPGGVTTNESPVDVYIREFSNSPVKSDANSLTEDESGYKANANITAEDHVFTISAETGNVTNHTGCWNGNQEAWAQWENGHPYAFYEIKGGTQAQVDAYNDLATSMQTLSPYHMQQAYGLVKDASQYSSNKPEPSEGSLGALIDGNFSTYFHTAWSTGEEDINSETHYLQADFAAPVGEFRFYFRKREGNNNNRPTNITVQGSTDGTSYTDITHITEGLPTNANDVDYLSAVIEGGSYTHLRFVVNATSTGTVFFHFSEFYILPANADVNGWAELHTSFAATDFTTDLATLNDLQAKADGITESIADLVSLNEALGELNTLYVKSEGYADAPFGDGLNQYPGSSEELTQARTQAETYLKSATTDDIAGIKELCTTLEGMMTLNLPETGKFYRIYGDNTGSPRYMSAPATTGKQTSLQLSETADASTILFYTADRNLLTYANGLYCNSNFQSPVDGAKHTYTFQQAANGELGCYNIRPSQGNPLYEYNTTVDKWSDITNGRCNWQLEAVKALPVSISAAGFATLYAPVALEIPTGITAYTGTVDGEVLMLTALNGIIPANTGVILEGNGGSYDFAISGTEASAPANELRGSIETVNAGTGYYTLQQQNGEVGLYPFNGTTLQGFKAYINNVSGVKGLAFDFGSTTGIGGLNTDNSKALEIYDLSGRRVTKPGKGLYIVNGKKVIIK